MNTDVIEMKGLILTLIVGVFFLIGIEIPKLTSKKKEVTLFATSMALIVILEMIFFDIIPEIKENIYELGKNRWLFVFGLTILGMALLKLLDLVVPHHHHEHKEKEKNKKEHNEHLFHIGLVTGMSLLLHNIIEGMSIYGTSTADFKAGIMMAIAVSLHNIPLGMEISASMSATDTKKKTKWITIIVLSLSSFIGAFILFLMKQQISITLLTGILCVTLGMLLYIALFELLKEVWMQEKSKPIFYGIGAGMIVTIIMVLL